eukprot:m51a1_g14142 hypothetical protein (387) ;mRNA; f:5654-6814
MATRPQVEVYETAERPAVRGTSGPLPPLLQGPAPADAPAADGTDGTGGIDASALCPAAARAALAGKELPCPSAQSDQSGQCPCRCGCRCCEGQGLGRRPPETLGQRYARLCREADALAGELAACDPQALAQLQPPVAPADAAALKTRLRAALAAAAALGPGDLCAALQGQQQQQQQGAQGAQQGVATYELLVAEEAGQRGRQLAAEVAAAERRLAALEALVGPAGPGAPVPLGEAVAEWRKRLHGLTPSQLDALGVRLAEANGAMEAFHRLSAAAAGPAVAPEDVATINRVHAGMQRWEAALRLVPAVAQRLAQLEPLRKGAASAALDLQRAEDAQRAAEQQLSDTAALVQRMEQSMRDNAATMLDNIALIQSRIDACRQQQQQQQ